MTHVKVSLLKTLQHIQFWILVTLSRNRLYGGKTNQVIDETQLSYLSYLAHLSVNEISMRIQRWFQLLSNL